MPDDAPPTVTSLLLARRGDASAGLMFEDQRWTWQEHVQACADRAALLKSLRRPGPFHVGVLLDNVPEFAVLLGAASLCGAVIVGLNPTRRGDELARDVRVTDCQLVVTESRHAGLLDGLDLGVSAGGVLDDDSHDYAALAGAHRGAEIPEPAPNQSDLFMLIFTSGTSGQPKAVKCTHRKVAGPGVSLATRHELTSGDVCYLSMPLFHSNAIMAGWAPALAAGATMVLRRRFSASQFLPDVRRYGVTYFNYVGKPLTYILATPEQPDDADNALRVAFGNEGADGDLHRFAERFGCQVVDGFGSTEGGVGVGRTPDTPPGSIGRLGPGVKILDSETGDECPPARFDDNGRLLNPDEAIGELVNTRGGGSFEGYYNDPDAEQERMRGGMYWSGDLAYADENGFVFFAGRSLDWLRVDGENLAAAPIERILARHPDVVLPAVYAVPDAAVGDQVMAALHLRDGARFDPDAFDRFLAGQPDMGTKWRPRFVRIAERLPTTETNKVLKRVLARERWECDEPVWWRPGRDDGYRTLTPGDVSVIRSEFERRGRASVLDR